MDAPGRCDAIRGAGKIIARPQKERSAAREIEGTLLVGVIYDVAPPRGRGVRASTGVDSARVDCQRVTEGKQNLVGPG